MLKIVAMLASFFVASEVIAQTLPRYEIHELDHGIEKHGPGQPGNLIYRAIVVDRVRNLLLTCWVTIGGPTNGIVQQKRCGAGGLDPPPPNLADVTVAEPKWEYYVAPMGTVPQKAIWLVNQKTGAVSFCGLALPVGCFFLDVK